MQRPAPAGRMEIDNQKLDEMTRALPYLTAFNDKYGLQGANQMAAPVEPRTPNPRPGGAGQRTRP